MIEKCIIQNPLPVKERMKFADVMRVSLDEFSQKTFSVNDCFVYPGKLFNLKEFDISDS